MIYDYFRGENPLIKYSAEIPFLNNKIEFVPGINLIVGPNGSGKSTLIKSLAKLLFCYEHGYSVFVGLSDFGKFFSFTEDIDFSDRMTHNNEPALYNNRYDDHEINSFEAKASLQSFLAQSRSSFGELQGYEFNAMIENFEKLKSFKEMAKIFKRKCNDTYKQRCDSYMKWLEIGYKKDCKKLTFLLDEPTSNLDISNRIQYWEVIDKLKNHGYQIIIAAHDITPFLKKMDYNLIETEDGYVDKWIKPYLQG